MINSIKNGDQPLPRVTQVSIAGTTSTEQPPLKDKSMWYDQEKRVQKIDRLARSLLIQGLPNDIYYLIDRNKTAKDLWDALARHMLGSEYGKQDRKAAVLYEYETFKATEGELLLDTYIRYLQLINDLKKCGYSKDNFEMSRDVFTVGSTMRISLLYRGEYSQWVERFMNYHEEQTDGEAMINSIKNGEYSQWVERFMNYHEEQTDGEAMINSIKNGDQPLPRVSQVSIAGTTSTEQPPLKDKSMWSDQEKRTQKIDRPARSLLIQGLPNDIYSLIDNNKTAKYLWDALARHMLGSEYGEQDRKAAKCGYSKDNCELNFQFLNNLQPEWKQYATMMRQNKNLMDINIDALYNILKQNQGDVNDAMGSKKKTVVVTSDPLALIADKTNVSRSKEKVVVSSDSKGSEADDFSELKKINALLAKAFNQRKFYSKPTNNNLRTSSSSQSANKKQEFVKSDDKKVEKKADEKKRDMSILDSDQEINANMVFMAQIKKVLFDYEACSSSADEKISEVSYYLSESESEYEFETLEYYDNSTNHGLFVNNDDDQEIFHDAIESASENFIENHIDS
nr:hypothetical protein [Tanacetum cinerariifolium]